MAQWHVGALRSVCSRTSSDPFDLKTPCWPLSWHIAASRLLVLSYGRFFLTVFSSSWFSFQKPAFWSVIMDCQPKEKTDFDLLSYSVSLWAPSSLLHWDSGSSWKGLLAVRPGIFRCVLKWGSSSNSSRNGNSDLFGAPTNFAEREGVLESTSNCSELSAPKALLGPDFRQGRLWASLRDRKDRALGAFSLGSLPKGGIKLQEKIEIVESDCVHKNQEADHNLFHDMFETRHAVSNFSQYWHVVIVSRIILMTCVVISMDSDFQITSHLCKGLS